MTLGYCQSFYGASKDRSIVEIVCGVHAGSSLLPTAFNECLSSALTLRDEGKATHLAMLHADITADQGWLDTLWGEMWLHQADFMSAVVAIKAPGGRTSTGIGLADDRWTVPRCVYLDDLATLPDTFGPEHVCKPGEVLLANTGCWLADIRKPFWSGYAFNLFSRVRKVPTSTGGEAWTVETRSEDWELSHDMNAAGMRYMVTQRVKTWHEGGGRWPNHSA